MLIPCDEVNILNTFGVMIKSLRLLLLLTNLHLKLLSTQGTGADKLLSTQRVKSLVCNNSTLYTIICIILNNMVLSIFKIFYNLTLYLKFERPILNYFYHNTTDHKQKWQTLSPSNISLCLES